MNDIKIKKSSSRLNLEKEYTYLGVRFFLFWLFTFLFITFTPVIVYYSLGYKFDLRLKKFLKTGAISIKTSPKGASVYFGNKQTNSETSPCIIRELIPNEYTISLEKDGFYQYQMPVKVNSGLVTEIDVVLVPKMKDIEKIRFHFDIYRFFFSKSYLNTKIIAFTDRGIYFVDKDLLNCKQITGEKLNRDVVDTIEGVRETNNILVFWNENNIWCIRILSETGDNVVEHIYTAQENIKYISYGLKDRYLVIHDGLKIILLDINNPKMQFFVYELASINSKVFYDSRSEVMYLKDKVSTSNMFSLFKINLNSIPHEKKAN